MAHTCPSCGALCFCKGDIDDIDMGEWIGCRHWEECEEETDPDDEDYYDYDDEGLTTKPPLPPSIIVKE